MDAFPKIDRRTFFDSMRRRFGRLKQEQVDGADDLLSSMESDPELTDIRHAAYMLATAWHETAATLKPICEYGSRKYFDRRYDPVLASTGARRARARRTVNGTDKAWKIANYATAFEACLLAGAAAANKSDSACLPAACLRR